MTKNTNILSSSKLWFGVFHSIEICVTKITDVHSGLSHRMQRCMFKCVKNWRWSWPLVSLISVLVGWKKQNTGWQTVCLEWKKSHCSLSCRPGFPPGHSTTDIMAKEWASHWSVRMIHCQFTRLFLRLRSLQQLGRLNQSPNHSCNLPIDRCDGAALIGKECAEMTSSQVLIGLNKVSRGHIWSGPVGFVQAILWHVLCVWTVLCYGTVFKSLCSAFE